MSALILVINNVLVTVFGCVLSASFCGMGKDAKSRRQIAALTAAILALQGIAVLCRLGNQIRVWFPLLTHLPLIVFLCCLTKQRLWAVGSVFMAYLCCQLRRWIGLLILLAFNGGSVELAVIEILLTAPILFALLRWVTPAVSGLSSQSVSIQIQFCLLPALYYVYDYSTIVYTDLLYSGNPAVVEFMPFICCLAYIAFLLKVCEENRRSGELEADRRNLNLQLEQSVRELAALREAQNRAAAYRHDLRHHLQYLSACIENGEPAKAQSYIQGIYAEIEAQKTAVFCENEEVNLILSAYAGRAAKAGVAMDIKVSLSQIVGITPNDLCVLLSNGLENALHACTELPENGPQKEIQVRGHEKKGRMYLQIVNPCFGALNFKNGLPLTNHPGHGIGTHSIRAITERYGGLCSFSVEDGKFILRVSI